MKRRGYSIPNRYTKRTLLIQITHVIFIIWFDMNEVNRTENLKKVLGTPIVQDPLLPFFLFIYLYTEVSQKLDICSGHLDI